MYETLQEFVKVEDVYVPAEFYLRCPGDADQPSLLITFQVRDGAPVCTAVNLESKAQGRQVLSTDFETIRRKLNGWSEVAFKQVLHTGQESGGTRMIALGPVDPAAARTAYNAVQKRTRRKITDKKLKEVAALYRDNVDDGPWQAIMDRFGVSESTAGRYVLLARKAGYLPQTEPGKKKA
ncbi:hypothetical protein [uncultured Mycobacterium sp.]|uniref:hypothetical protein n=1 Tax=uncultured Mycobacterium sp. TaxID=171292 RepID=UPI0035CB3F82